MYHPHPLAMRFQWLAIIIGFLMFTLTIGCTPATNGDGTLTTSGSAQLQPELYRHPLLGFTVEIPPSWKGRYRITTDTHDENVIVTSFDYTGGGEPASFIFRIIAYSTAAWNEMVNGTEPLLNIEAFARTKTHVFTVTRALDTAYTGPVQQEYNRMAQDIDEIINSFSLPGAEPYTYVSYYVFFGNNAFNLHKECAATFPVMRNVEDKQNIPLAMIKKLFAGPTDEEKKQGYQSFFSRQTAGAVRSLRLKNGTAYLDLKDLRQQIPNASSSCGSAEFLSQVDATLTQFPEIQRVIMAFDGDTKAFYDWVQLGCSAENDQCDNKPFQESSR
ncbi:MAG: hypothetical protein JWM56_745 [Candidatus Peribacteria bacterium]|nr:hypothetical protein [Candidatus Peribacteria bacterium]